MIIDDRISKDWKSANKEHTLIYDYMDQKEGDDVYQCTTWAVEVLRDADIHGLPKAGTCREPLDLKNQLDMGPFPRKAR